MEQTPLPAHSCREVSDTEWTCPGTSDKHYLWKKNIIRHYKNHCCNVYLNPQCNKKKGWMYYENSSRDMQMVISYAHHSDLPGSYCLHPVTVKGRWKAQMNTLNLDIVSFMSVSEISLLGNISNEKTKRRQKVNFELPSCVLSLRLKISVSWLTLWIELLSGRHDLLIPALFFILVQTGHPWTPNVETSVLVISIKLIPENDV